MADISVSAPLSHGFFHRIADALLAVGKAMMAMSAANERIRKVELLNAMSDEELATRGIRREDIARHVFADCMI
ncbi:MAG: DUF1127 domain-containing protein [Paracoccaceae bacterium]